MICESLTTGMPTDTAKIKSVIEKRLIQAAPAIKAAFPPVLRQHRVMSAIVSEPQYLMVVFFTEKEEKRFMKCITLQTDPFVGLITTGSEKATLRADKARYVTVRSCTIGNNFFGFSLGSDSTILLEDHHQIIETADIGKVSYTVSLAYIISYGEEIVQSTIHEHFDCLVAYSMNMWREKLWFTNCVSSVSDFETFSGFKGFRN